MSMIRSLLLLVNRPCTIVQTRHLTLYQVENTMTQEQSTKPPSLTEVQLKKLVLEAIDDAADTNNPETFHALFGHLDRGLQTNDVIHGLEANWKFERSPVFNEFYWQWKYYIETESVGGDAILIIIAVDTLRREFEVITRWRQ